MRDPLPGGDTRGMMFEQRLVIGIDGGGTKTDACLARIGSHGEERILGYGQSGSSNVKAVGQETALANLFAAIGEAWSHAELAPETAYMAVFGLSGAGRPETQAMIAAWAKNHQIAKHVRVVHDALPVLIAGTPAGQGVALIAGTGAVAFAADEQKNTAVSGGWGYWFGDEGSAFWLGQAAARAVSQAADGRTAPTLLTKLILAELEIDEPRELLTVLSRENNVRGALAGLAELVTDCASQGDRTAQEIVAQAAEQLAALVISAAKQLELGNTFPLALAGGVVCGSATVRARLLERLAALRITPSSVTVVTRPVLGCVGLASRELTAQPN